MAALTTLRATRESRGLSCQAVGRLIGKTPSHYAKIERGEIQLNARDALTLCNAFALPLVDLLSTIDTPHRITS